MRSMFYKALTAVCVAATVAAVVYAYGERGGFAVGGEYGLLLVPLIALAFDSTREGYDGHR